MIEPSRIEVSGTWGSLAGTYDGHEYRLKIEFTLGAEDIALDEHDAQRLGLWLSQQAAGEHKRRREERRWHPEGS